jgi:hypothetical protein
MFAFSVHCRVLPARTRMERTRLYGVTRVARSKFFTLHILEIKVKLPLCLINNNVMKMYMGWRYSSTNCCPLQYLEVVSFISQLLRPGRPAPPTPNPLTRELCGFQNQSGCHAEEQKTLTLTSNRTRIPLSSSYSLVPISTEL